MAALRTRRYKYTQFITHIFGVARRDGLIRRCNSFHCAFAFRKIFDFLEQKPHLYLLNYNYLVLVRVRRADDAAADD